jgi:hypothetical protein
MNRPEYLEEYKRLAALRQRNWEALAPLIMEPVTMANSLSAYVLLSEEEKRLREEQGYLVLHWPEMPSPSLDE